MTISVVVRSTVHQQQFQLPSPCALADLVLDDETCPFTEVDVHLRKEGVNSSWGQPVLENVRMSWAVSSELIQASVFFYGARTYVGTAMLEMVRTRAKLHLLLDFPITAILAPTRTSFCSRLGAQNVPHA